jgi:DNA-binding transcriptional ArsR family regulator
MPGPIPDAFLDLMAVKFRMLADPTRLAILRALMQGERSVSEVVEETGRNQANVSKHLKLLAEGGLVARRKQGLQVFYRLDDPLVERLCALVCETIVEEAREELDRQSRLLSGWQEGGADRRSGPGRAGRAGSSAPARRSGREVPGDS